MLLLHTGEYSPKYCSTLTTIQILSLVEAPVLEKYGHNKALQQAVEDIKKLENINLVQVY